MSTLKKFRFTMLIGAGVVAAGVLIYVSNTRINSRQAEGAIGQRDVYRDAKVDASDIAAPGNAPVAAKVLLESKEFQSLSKDEAFRNLVADESFLRLARDAQFQRLMRDSHFQKLLGNDAFVSLMRVKSAADLSAQLKKKDSELVSALGRKDAQSLANDQAFQGLMNNANFNALFKNHADSASLSVLQRTDFQSLMAQAAFRDALESGLAARMSSQLYQAAAKK